MMFFEKSPIICLQPNRFPKLLRRLPQPPKQLFVRGDPKALDHVLVAIVGTRRATQEGLLFARLLTEALNTSSEIVTVSGLAFGIDAVVHQTAVAAGRPTIAVLPSSVEIVSPSSHTSLARDIVKNGGCLISEYPEGTHADKGRFPARNRIIAGLAQATVVIEAGQPSGALITAAHALDLNRDVFAVPGSPFNASAAGSNALLKRGAYVLTQPEDLLEHLGFEFKPAPAAALSDESNSILAALSEPRSVDQLAEACTIPVARLAALLSVLELEGHIRTLPDQRIVAIHHSSP